jgi:NADH-quinone oxidoreductase subunit C
MDAKGIYDYVAGKLGDAVSDYTDKGTKDPWFKAKPERWLEVAQLLRDDAELRFDFLNNLTAVDWPKQNKIEVVYHFYSYPKRHACVVKVDLPREKPDVPSLAGLWRSADWNEREQFDLYGVAFIGHPDLRRIMLPDDWPGHPGRKDYKEAESYRGMSTTRPNTLELLPMYDKAPPEAKQPKEASDE